MIAGIRTIKAYAWERVFEKKIEQIREKQIRCIYRGSNVQTTNITLNSALSGQMIAFFIILVIYLLNQDLSGSLVYFIVGFIYNVQYYCIVRMTYGILFNTRFKSFMQRLDTVVNLPSKRDLANTDCSGDRLRLS